MAEEAKANSVSSLKNMFEQNTKPADPTAFKPKPLVSSLGTKLAAQVAQTLSQQVTKEAPKKIDANSWMKKDSPDNSPKNAFAAVKLTSSTAPPKKLDSPFLNQVSNPPTE